MSDNNAQSITITFTLDEIECLLNVIQQWEQSVIASKITYVRTMYNGLDTVRYKLMIARDKINKE